MCTQRELAGFLFALLAISAPEAGSAQAPVQPAAQAANPFTSLLGGGPSLLPANLFQPNPAPLQQATSVVESASQSVQPAQQGLQTRLVEFGQSLKQIVDRSPNLVPDVRNLFNSNAKVSQQTNVSSTLPGGLQQDAGASTSLTGNSLLNPLGGVMGSLFPSQRSNQDSAKDAFDKISASFGLPPQNSG